jgi:hypothetical protein
MAVAKEAGPDTAHPDYDAALPQWQMMADVLAGEDAVKAAGAKYLPMFDETDQQEYERYKSRADFDEVTLRAVKAMRGFLFRKDPRLSAPGHDPGKPAVKRGQQQQNTPFDQFIEDATLTGKEFYDVAKDCATLVLDYGRGGSLIDWNEEEKQPFTVQYAAIDIINWRYERVNGRMMLTQIVLHERDPNLYDTKGNKSSASNNYDHVFHDQWRELRLEGNGVTQYLWRKKEAKGKEEFYLVQPPSQPMRGGKPLSAIPFVFHTADGPFGEYVCQPPLIPLARTNLSLYRTNADLENARHVLGMPTPYSCGFGDTSTPLFLGSTRAWSTDQTDAKCGFLALTGTEIQPLTDAVKEKQDKMAAFGARFLDTAGRAGGARSPEAFYTVALRQTAETASLTDISLALTQSLTDVLGWALWWSTSMATVADAREVVNYEINTDFIGMIMDAPTMTSLMGLYLQKGISFETLFARLQGADIIPSDRTVDEEKVLIQKGESMLLSLAARSVAPNGQVPPPAPGAPPPPAKPPPGKAPPPPARKPPAPIRKTAA